jgi:hypothetical protein
LLALRGAGEEHLDVLGPAEVEVVGHERLEEGGRAGGVIEDDGAGDLNLARR